MPREKGVGRTLERAAGLAHDVPVVSRNTRHFERVPGLSVVSYTEPQKDL